MGCVQCKDKEATKLTEERDGSLNQSSGYRYGTDPTPQHYPSFGVTSIPNYNNFHAAGGQGLTVFGGVNSSSHTGTLRTRGGTGKLLSARWCAGLQGGRVAAPRSAGRGTLGLVTAFDQDWNMEVSRQLLPLLCQ